MTSISQEDLGAFEGDDVQEARDVQDDGPNEPAALVAMRDVLQFIRQENPDRALSALRRVEGHLGTSSTAADASLEGTREAIDERRWSAARECAGAAGRELDLAAAETYEGP